MTDGPQPQGIEINASGRKLIFHRTHGRLMISDWTAGLSDPFDDALGLHFGSLRYHELVLQGRGAGVQDQDRRLDHPGLPAVSGWERWACLMACAWTAVIATVFTMSDISAPRDRSLTGLRSPCSTGPMAMALALRCTAL